MVGELDAAYIINKPQRRETCFSECTINDTAGTVPVNLLAATIYYETTVHRGTVLFADPSSPTFRSRDDECFLSMRITRPIFTTRFHYFSTDPYFEVFVITKIQVSIQCNKIGN